MISLRHVHLRFDGMVEFDYWSCEKDGVSWDQRVCLCDCNIENTKGSDNQEQRIRKLDEEGFRCWVEEVIHYSFEWRDN